MTKEIVIKVSLDLSSVQEAMQAMAATLAANVGPTTAATTTAKTGSPENKNAGAASEKKTSTASKGKGKGKPAIEAAAEELDATGIEDAASEDDDGLGLGDDVADETPEYTKEDVFEALRSYQARTSTADVRALFTKIKVKNAQEIKPAQYAKVIEACRE